MGEQPAQVPLQLRLYVSRHTPESAAVEANLRRVCDEVGLVYEVEVLDVREHPERADEDRIVLTPTLLRVTPPRLRVAGDLSDIEAAMDGLGLRLWGLHGGDRPRGGEAGTDGGRGDHEGGDRDEPAAGEDRDEPAAGTGAGVGAE
jgi:circadian clock protein KaiB